MELHSRASGIFFGGPTPAAPRNQLPHRLRSTACTALLCIATGLGAASWSGHHALGQARTTLRATLDDDTASPVVRRAAQAAICREVTMDLRKIMDLAKSDQGERGDDARAFLERLRHHVNR
jgi:hypothetical protein